MKDAAISESGKKFVPLLFGGDINVYSVARAFHEAYGAISHAFGKYPSGPCTNSRIIEYTAVEDIEEAEVFRRTVERFAADNEDKTVLLIACGDSYAALASRFKDEFPPNVEAPYIDFELMKALTNKEKFYQLCGQRGIDYPRTFVYRPEAGDDFNLPFEPPYIIKPADSVEYWKYPFPSQKKVFKAEDDGELRSILARIRDSGYGQAVIIQEFIPGDDSFMRVLSCYSDKGGRVVLMCLGHVLLEEHTPHGIGNHAVIITQSDRALMQRFRTLLDSLQYRGWSNFDIKYDSRDGKYKAFEINCRQGRSNYYITGSGANLADYLVKDILDNKVLPFKIADEENLWLVVPRTVAFQYVNDEYAPKMKELIGRGKVCNPLYYSEDRGFRRLLGLAKNMFGHFIKYRKYLGKES